MRLSSEAMTRAEFIQQATLSIVRSGNTQEHAITEAVRLAGKLEATEKAPWSNPNESVLLKRIEDEAHRRGYLLGEKDGRQYAADEQNWLLCLGETVAAKIVAEEPVFSMIERAAPVEPVFTVTGVDGRVVEKKSDA